MESPQEYGILLARSQLALRHVVLCSVKDGTLAEQSALVRLQASLQTHFACLSLTACIYLCIDYIRHLVLIPYKAYALILYPSQATDLIHAFRAVYLLQAGGIDNLGLL